MRLRGRFRQSRADGRGVGCRRVRAGGARVGRRRVRAGEARGGPRTKARTYGADAAVVVAGTYGGDAVVVVAGVYGADAVVVAAGVRSRAVCRSPGAPLGLAAGRGYGFAVPADPAPRRPVHPGTAKTVPTPLGRGVRVGRDDGVRPRDPDRFRQGRVAALVAAARPYPPGAGRERWEQERTGPRPMPGRPPADRPAPRPAPDPAGHRPQHARSDAGPGDRTAGGRVADGGGGPEPRGPVRTGARENSARAPRVRSREDPGAGGKPVTPTAAPSGPPRWSA